MNRPYEQLRLFFFEKKIKMANSKNLILHELYSQLPICENVVRINSEFVVGSGEDLGKKVTD